MDYQSILKKFVLDPASIESFGIHKPENAKFNPNDPVAPHIVGGPAGGYWSTPQDLLKLAEWLRKKCTQEKFMRLLGQYGGEFYHKESKEVSHGGSIRSSSAHLSYRIDNQLAIVMMSDKNGKGKASMFCQAIQRHLL